MSPLMRHFTPRAHFSGWGGGVMRLQATFWEKESVPPPQRKRKGLVPQPGILGKWLQVCPESEAPCVHPLLPVRVFAFPGNPTGWVCPTVGRSGIEVKPQARVRTVPALQEPAWEDGFILLLLRPLKPDGDPVPPLSGFRVV